MEKYTEKEVVEYFERSVKNRLSLDLLNKMPRTSRTLFIHGEVRDDLTRVIVGLLNSDTDNKIQIITDDINKERRRNECNMEDRRYEKTMAAS